ncbi:DUF3182 family protein [Dokdonella koreensis]|uniref:Biotin carboxylase n=1 Tax=Dokdonella koreensis DS-123 TaxID=1300342 RepID=A0A160DT61_9GAMM|nr:DUF3182 family protein [Dokdonella koreensis]ANB17537.1 Biotin carboxylase [Dokdonella koreensis DS-123]
MIGVAGVPGCVALLSRRAGRRPDGHEARTHAALAQRIAALTGRTYVGEHETGRRYAEPVYFVPDRTLLQREAAELGIGGEADLFGGVVPFAFVATKTISHPALDAQARVPEGWVHALGERLADAVLPGYSVFTRADLRRAGEDLLAGGAVRIKAAHESGGNGQQVAATAAALADHVAVVDEAVLERHGAVVERDLAQAVTYSVGEVLLAGMRVAYVGSQRQTVNHRGAEVYGGSDLTVVRGRFQDLLALDLPDALRQAVAQVCRYDAEAMRAYPGTYASRRNYDVIAGRDGDGRPASGVLEQSWRIGGASGAELLAIEALARDPALQRVRAATCEVYGERVPADAEVHYRGRDERVGYLVKYSLLHRE